MKVLLIQPPVRDFYRTSIRTQPIGLAYLAAPLLSRGHEVEILDCRTAKKKSMPIPPELSYLKDFYPFDDRSPFKLYTGFYHFGMGWEEIRKKIEISRADVFGISSSFTPYHGEALQVAQIIKEWDSKKIVVMGGSHASCDPKGVLKSPFVDYVILGEGEYRLPFLLDCLEKGKQEEVGLVDGIGYRRNGEIHMNQLQSFIPILDSVPFPARDLLEPDRYRINKKRSTMILTSRGCPHGCAYCSAHLVMGSSFRVRSPENILREMMECREKYEIEAFDIEDDNFTFDTARAKRLLRLIVETFGANRLELFAMNGLSFVSLDGELLDLMKKAGFHTLNLSLVSSEPSTKKKMRRPQPVAEFHDVLTEAQQAGLNVVAYAILGMPGQTVEEMVDTLIYLMGERVLIGPSIYYPTPGTVLFKRCDLESLLPNDISQWRSSALPIETKAFDRPDLATLLRIARVINFIKGKMDERELEEGMTWRELSQILKDKGPSHHPIFVTPAKAGVQSFQRIQDSCVRRNDAFRGTPKFNNGTRTWAALFLMLCEEKSFFGLRKNRSGEFTIQKETTSKRVLDCFFERAWGKPVLKSRKD